MRKQINEKNLYNEQLYPIQTMIIKWMTTIITSIAAIFSVVISLVSNKNY